MAKRHPSQLHDDPAPAGAPFRALPRGAKPTPAHKLAAAPAYSPTERAPGQFAYLPPKLDYWDNSKYGDCVTAEEAFARACYEPSIFIPPAEVVRWARAHGVLNGAFLDEVLDMMHATGFKVGTQEYRCGEKLRVDYGNESVLQGAISDPDGFGPVKVAIDADALPSGAGQHQGWYAFGGGRHPNTDHCVSICGYGPTAWLFEKLGVPAPGGMPANGYLLYTWSTIGVVDHAWLMGTCVEAWTRKPCTVGVPPLPPPTPKPPPPPPPPPPPGPEVVKLTLSGPLPAGEYLVLPPDARALTEALGRALRGSNREGIKSGVDLCQALGEVVTILCRWIGPGKKC